MCIRDRHRRAADGRHPSDLKVVRARQELLVPHARRERDLLGAIPDFLLNYTRYRNWFETVSRTDIEAFLGESFDDLAAADAAVQARIDTDDPADDNELVRLMHRRMLRLSMITAGTNPDETNPFFYILEPVIDRERDE